MMRMMNNEKYKRSLLDKNAIFHIGNSYSFVILDLTEFGLVITSMSEEYDTLDEAVKKRMIMQKKFRMKCRTFRQRIMLLSAIAGSPIFRERKNDYCYELRTRSERGRSFCFRYGGFKSYSEAKNHWLNNRINILKRILGDDYE